MTIVNITVEIEEEYNNDNDYGDDITCYGVIKMNDIPVFKVKVNSYYQDTDEVLRAFGEHLAK